MTAFIAGLALFLGVHSVRIFADGWRTAQIARLGAPAWKGLYSLASVAGFALMAWGYGLTRTTPVDVWNPPGWTRHPAMLLMLVAFVLVAAAYVPGNRIRAAVGHPMVAGVKVWALAHLLCNGRLGDVVLFGALLVWAILDFRASRRRDRANGVVRAARSPSRDAITIVAGVVAYAVFGFVLHGMLIGVRPFG